jgi:hypothetical protein
MANNILWFDFADSIYMGVLAMAASFIIVPIVSKFTKKPENVDEIFACYERRVVVPEGEVLLDSKDKIVLEEVKEEASA